MPQASGVEWSRRVVRNKIIITMLIAVIGSMLVIAGSSIPDRIIVFTGLLLVLLSPIISYMIVLKYYR